MRFFKGAVEQMPLPDDAVDMLISNCVINLSAAKDAMLRGASSVLKPGGRFAVSDVVTPRTSRRRSARSMKSSTRCVAGALYERDYRRSSAPPGHRPRVQVTRTYGLADLQDDDSDDGEGSCYGAPEAAPAEDLAATEGALASAFVRATKPA